MRKEEKQGVAGKVSHEMGRFCYEPQHRGMEECSVTVREAFLNDVLPDTGVDHDHNATPQAESLDSPEEVLLQHSHSSDYPSGSTLR